MTTVRLGGRVFESGREGPIEVSCLKRPDPSWLFVDRAGHVHRWCTEDGRPAVGYRPEVRYGVPSAVVVRDPSWYDEDGEEIERAHLECRECRQVVEPRTTSDSTRQYVAGLNVYRIDGQLVDEATFRAEIAKALATPATPNLAIGGPR